MKFRKKSIIVEAFKWTGDEKQTKDPIWIVQAIRNLKVKIDYPNLFIETLEGVMKADIDDWIIQGVNGEIYPCKPDIFKKTYEKVN